MRRRIRQVVVAAALLAPALALARDVRRPRQPNTQRRTPQGGGGGGCNDPIQGVWVSRRYNSTFQRWEVFTLTVLRTAPGADALTGTIEMRTWRGTVQQTTPVCAGYMARDVTWEQAARGTFAGARFTFDGTHARVRELRCGSVSSYHLDHFEGSLDAARHVITTTNNDGVVELDVPHEFTRVRCL